jgi:hypothetical protein
MYTYLHAHIYIYIHIQLYKEHLELGDYAGARRALALGMETARTLMDQDMLKELLQYAREVDEAELAEVCVCLYVCVHVLYVCRRDSMCVCVCGSRYVERIIAVC